MIIGHEGQIEGLYQRIKNNKLPHAILLSGPAGVGKRAVLYWLSQKILCETKQENCHCASCVKFDSGNHPDFHCVDESGGRIKKDALEKGLETFYTMAYERGNKVFAVIEADQMSEILQNKLLKKIEEPPPHTYWILHTKERDKIMHTLVSRMHEVRFGPIKESEMKAHLMMHENTSEEMAIAISKAAYGNLDQMRALLKEPERLSLKLQVFQQSADFLRRKERYFDLRAFWMAQKKEINLMTGYLQEFLLQLQWDGHMGHEKAPRLQNMEAEKIHFEAIDALIHDMDEIDAMMKCNVNLDLIVDNLLIKLKEVYG